MQLQTENNTQIKRQVIDYRLDGNAIYALSHLVGKDQSRYSLSGINIERHSSGKGAVYVATNGHIMGVFYDKDAIIPEDVKDDSGEVIRFSKDILKYLSKKTNKDSVIKISQSRIEVGNISEDVKFIDTIYPDWRRVIDGIKKQDPSPIVNLDSYYLSLFPKMFNKKNLGIQIHPQDELPVKILVEQQPNYLFVLMPMRIKNSGIIDNHKRIIG